MISNPIFIIGTERSGSNLLRLLLNSHSRIAIPHPPHLMRDMGPIAKFYGDLTVEKNFRELAGNVASFVNMHFAPWPFGVSADKLLARAESRSIYGLYAGLYEMYLEHTGKARWGCKSTFMYQNISEVLANHAEPRFLHLVRDPRDVAASAEKSIFSKYHPYKEAELWSEQQSAIEAWASKLGPEKLMRIRYEDLTADAEGVMGRVMEFLGEKFERDQMLFFRSQEAARLSKLSESWNKCDRPISQNSVGRFRLEFTSKEVGWVESQAHSLMQKYGYETDFSNPPPPPSRVERLRIEGFERWKMLETEGRSLIKDGNFGIRWKKWLYLQYLRGTRSMTHG